MRGRCIAAAVVASVLIGANGASASFPGRNGLLTFTYDPACEVTVACGKSTIYTIVPGGRPRRLIAPFGSVGVSDPAWSPNGRTIAFSAWVDKQAIWVARANGGGHRVLSDQAHGVFAPAWSPDGKKLLFSNGDLAVGVMNADGSNSHILYKHAAHATWSPNGKTIMFEDDFDGVSVMDTTGRHVRRLLRDAIDPSWAPDGRRVAYVSSTGLAVAAADGTHQHTLLRSAFVRTPVWSPDGRKIAYILVQRHPGVYLMNSDGTHLRRLTRLEAEPSTGIDWQPIR